MMRTKIFRLEHVVQLRHRPAGVGERGDLEVCFPLGCPSSLVCKNMINVFWSQNVVFQEDTTNRTPLKEDEVVRPLDELSGPPTHTLDDFMFVLDDGSTADLRNIDQPDCDKYIYARGMVCVRSLEAQEEDDAEEQAAEPNPPADCLFTRVGPITKWFAGDGVTEK